MDSLITPGYTNNTNRFHDVNKAQIKQRMVHNFTDNDYYYRLMLITQNETRLSQEMSTNIVLFP